MHGSRWKKWKLPCKFVEVADASMDAMESSMEAVAASMEVMEACIEAMGVSMEVMEYSTEAMEAYMEVVEPSMETKPSPSAHSPLMYFVGRLTALVSSRTVVEGEGSADGLQPLSVSASRTARRGARHGGAVPQGANQAHRCHA